MSPTFRACDKSRTILAVHVVYRDGAEALIPFVGGATQLSFAFEED
jgi:hypothetical protein